MLTLLGTKEDNVKTSTEYYYPPPAPHHYCCPVSFNNDSNSFHHHPPSIYETNQYYTLSSEYLHPPLNHHPNEADSNNLVSNSVYIPTYHHQQHYSTEGHTNEMFYPPKSSDQQPIIPVYDYNASPVSALSSNPMFHQNSNYVQPSVEPAHCSSSNSASYLTSYVSLKHKEIDSL
jgi:hypothetical protein